MQNQNLVKEAVSGGGVTTTDSIALWLHNKLHSPTHLWSFSSTVASQYTLEKLQAIRDCFYSLDSLVKIKFFLTLFHVPKRNYDEFKSVVHEILENTIQTCMDQWVLSIAAFVQPYWLTQRMSNDLDHELDSFRDAYNDLTRVLKECVESDDACERVKFLLPIETGYLNKSVRQSMLPAAALHHQQSSLLALTTSSSSLGHPSGVNEILLQLIGGELVNTAANMSSGGVGGMLSDFNDSIENGRGSGDGTGAERVKRHFNLIKSTKSMSLEELKYKGMSSHLYLYYPICFQTSLIITRC